MKTMTLPVRFTGRRFQLWSYSVSHRELLLRSNKSGAQSRRCEVLFTNVSHIDLPTLIDDLEIELGTEAMLTAEQFRFRAHDAFERSVYLIKGNDCSGHVVAGAMAFAEDDGDYADPSTLLQP